MRGCYLTWLIVCGGFVLFHDISGATRPGGDRPPRVDQFQPLGRVGTHTIQPLTNMILD